jgi:serine/threonine protein kinase
MGSLVGNGFLDVSLNPLLTNICDALPHAGDIARLGPEWDISGERWRFLDRSLSVPGTRVGWCIGAQTDAGSYGSVFKARRQVLFKRPQDGVFVRYEPEKEVAIKQVVPRDLAALMSAEDIKAYTSEALLHILAWRALQKSATPWAIPRPYEIFGERTTTGAPGWRKISFCMNYVRGETLMAYLASNWRPETRMENTRLFLEILGQLAYILHFLQVELRLNHRDVKSNNVMMRRRTYGHSATLTLGGASLQTGYAVSLIDFGFACVGCPPPQKSLTAFQAGSWFEMGEVCCKAGRDIAQLLICIHCSYPLDIYLTDTVAALVREWVQIPWRRGIADGLAGFTKKGYPNPAGSRAEYHKGVYKFLQRREVDPVACSPARIFKEVCRLLPTMS